MGKLKIYGVTITILFVVACSKQAIDELFSFKPPTYFPGTAYPLSSNTISKAGFELGKTIFFDSTLSIDNSTSCASCHMQSSAFTHHEHSLSHGLNGSLTKRNATPIMNLAWSNSFMWDGSVASLDKQPIRPLTSKIEMGETIDGVLRKMNGSPLYKTLFNKAFGVPKATEEKMFKALSQYMLMLISSNSKYDSVKRGEKTFSELESKGYEVFQQKCNSCHNEPLFTDFSFRNIGLAPNELADSGRYIATRNPSDIYKFKVPSLRNLTYTKPYMHDGRFSTLENVLIHYSSGILNMPNLDPIFKSSVLPRIQLAPEEIKPLLAFIKTLDDPTFVKNPLFDGHLNH